MVQPYIPALHSVVNRCSAFSSLWRPGYHCALSGLFSLLGPQRWNDPPVSCKTAESLLIIYCIMKSSGYTSPQTLSWPPFTCSSFPFTLTAKTELNSPLAMFNIVFLFLFFTSFLNHSFASFCCPLTFPHSWTTFSISKLYVLQHYPCCICFFVFFLFIYFFLSWGQWGTQQ